jgi:hypothetical protein
VKTDGNELIFNSHAKNCFCSRNDTVVIFSPGRISIYNISEATVCSWLSSYMKTGYGNNSPAISEGGLGELAIIINEKNLIEFV